MRLRILSETSLLFYIEYDGVGYVLRQNGGDWELMHNGAVIASSGGKRTEPLKALARALEQISKI